MYKLSIITLNGCKLCESLVGDIAKTDIEYKILNADTHESLCDMLEVLLQTNSYPIVAFEIPQRAYFICMPGYNERLGWKVLDDTSTSIGVTSVNEMFQTICELKNKI